MIHKEGTTNTNGRAFDTMSNGDFILASTYTTEESVKTIRLTRINSEGNEIWGETIATAKQGTPKAIMALPNNNYILAGETSDSDGWFLLIDETGSVKSEKTYGGAGDDSISNVLRTSDGDFILTGTWSGDAWLLKIDPYGNEIWSTVFGGTKTDISTDLIQLQGGEIIVVGYSYTIRANTEVFLRKFDLNGQEIWKKTYLFMDTNIIRSISRNTKGEIILAGEAYNREETKITQALLIKTDAEGNLIWNQLISNETGYSINDIIETPDGNYLMTGTLRNRDSHYADGLIMKTDSHGDYLWHLSFKMGTGGYGAQIKQTYDKEYAVIGYTLRQTWLWERGMSDQSYNPNMLFLQFSLKQ